MDDAMIVGENELQKFFQTADKKMTDEDKCNLEYKKEQIFKNFGKFLLPTLAKYGKELTIGALSDYLNVGTLVNFTRERGSRDKIATIDRLALLSFIQETYGDVNISVIAPQMVNDFITYGCNLVEKAALDTYIKFGYHQCRGALEYIVNENNMGYISNKNGARDNLIQSEIDFRTLPYLLANDLDLTDYVNSPSSVNINHGFLVSEYMRIIEEKIINFKNIQKSKK